MFCGNCGTRLEDHDRFCPNCGEPRHEQMPGRFDGDQTDVLPLETVEGAPLEDDWLSVHDSADYDSWGDYSWDNSAGVSPKPAEEPLKRKSSMDPSERHELVILTRAEAMSGCQKNIELDGQHLTIDIPPGISGSDSMSFPGYGYWNSSTGERGVLKVQFFID